MIDVGVLFQQAAAALRRERHATYRLQLGSTPTQDTDEPIETLTERLAAYMEKATKEAKRHTSWVNPSAGYDAATRGFVTGLLAPGGAFLSAFRPFQRLIAAHGAVNSLAQTLLKTVAPGIPDFYQGTELWELSLVDPDNRRPVDFRRRQALLDSLRARIPAADAGPSDLTALCAELLEHWRDGRVELYLTHRALTLRRRRARTGLTVATERHDGGAVLPAPALFAHFPVALLEREGGER